MANGRKRTHENEPGGRPPLRVARLFPNMVTILGLCVGLSAIRFALLERWELAAAFIGFAACIDAMDGRIARLFNATSSFGAQLDSLADFVNFGIAPPFILYWWSTQHLWTVHGIRGLGWGMVLFFAVCCAIRLARFNSDLDVDEPAEADHVFVGVPSPAGAMLALMPMALVFAFAKDFPRVYAVIDVVIDPLFVVAHATAVAILMASRLPTISFKTLSVPHDHAWLVLVATGIFVIALLTEPWLTMVLLGVWYVLTLLAAVIRYYWQAVRKLS